MRRGESDAEIAMVGIVEQHSWWTLRSIRARTRLPAWLLEAATIGIRETTKDQQGAVARTSSTSWS
jgi:hypothetical protein